MLAEKLLEDDRDAIVRAVIAAAKGGDPTAMRLCVERLVPLRKVTILPPASILNALSRARPRPEAVSAAGEGPYRGHARPIFNWSSTPP